MLAVAPGKLTPRTQGRQQAGVFALPGPPGPPPCGAPRALVSPVGGRRGSQRLTPAHSGSLTGVQQRAQPLWMVEDRFSQDLARGAWPSRVRGRAGPGPSPLPPPSPPPGSSCPARTGQVSSRELPPAAVPAGAPSWPPSPASPLTLPSSPTPCPPGSPISITPTPLGFSAG